MWINWMDWQFLFKTKIMEKIVNRKKELRKEKRIPFESYIFYSTEHQLYEGEIKVVESPNPFEEKVTLRHNGDFGGESDSRSFQWKYTRADFSGIPCRPELHEDDPDTCVPREWDEYEPMPLDLNVIDPDATGDPLPFLSALWTPSSREQESSCCRINGLLFIIISVIQMPIILTTSVPGPNLSFMRDGSSG